MMGSDNRIAQDHVEYNVHLKKDIKWETKSKLRRLQDDGEEIWWYMNKVQVIY